MNHWIFIVTSIDQEHSSKEGLPEENAKLHFASYGDPHFDAILDAFEPYDLPPSICHLSVRLRDLPTEVVGYAVACAGLGDTARVELVTSWQDLESLQILEDGEVPEQQISALRSKLRGRARKEFGVGPPGALNGRTSRRGTPKLPSFIFWHLDFLS